MSPNNPIFDGLHVWFGKDLVPDAALFIYQVRGLTLEVRWLVVSLNTSRASSIWTHVPKVTGALILDQLGKQQAPYHCGKQSLKGGLWTQTVTEFHCTFYSWQVFVVKLAFTMQTSGTCGNNLLWLRRRVLVQDPLCEQFHNVTVLNILWLMVIFLQNIQSLCSLGDITVATSIFFTVYVLSGETEVKVPCSQKPPWPVLIGIFLCSNSLSVISQLDSAWNWELLQPAGSSWPRYQQIHLQSVSQQWEKHALC